MTAIKRILLFGNSIAFGTVGSNFARCSEDEVAALKLPQKHLMWMGTVLSDKLIFDSQRTRPKDVMRYLKDNSVLK